MLNINLLNWRKQLENKQKKKAYVIVISFTLLVGFTLFWYVYPYQHELSEMEQQLALIHASKAQFEQKMMIESAEQAQSISTEKIFSVLSFSDHPSVCINRFDYRDSELILDARAQSNKAVIDFLLQWPGAKLFHAQKLVALRSLSDGTIEFKVALTDSVENEASTTAVTVS